MPRANCFYRKKTRGNDMKSVIVSLILAAAVVTGSLAYTHKMDGVTAEMSDINSQIIQSLENEDFIQAKENINDLKGCIEKNSIIMETMGNHEEVDKIKMNLSELERFTDGEKRTDALSKCSVLDFLIDHLSEVSHLTIENIL